MKKSVFTLLMTAGLGMTVMAQQPLQRIAVPEGPKVSFEETTVKPKGRTLSKTNISDWYITTDMAQGTNLGSSLTSRLNFMYGDTVAKMMYQSGELAHAFWLSCGHILDPKDDVISQTQNPLIQLSKYVSYKLDSIRFPFSYVRHVDSLDDGIGGKYPVVDTLFIYYHKGSTISKRFFTVSKDKVPVIDWDVNTLKAKNFFSVDTVLLTKDDSTGILNTNGFESNFIIKTASFAPRVPVAVDAKGGQDTVNNLVGVTLVFKSAVPTVTNGGQDTVAILLQQDPALFPTQKRGNMFGFRYLQNTNTAISLSNPTYYNISQMMPAWNAYGQTSGWNGNYIPTQLFASEIFTAFDFHMTTTSDNVGISDVKNNEFAVSQVYPNPARTSDKPVIAFNLMNNDSKVVVKVMNLLGQEVKTALSGVYNAGAHAEFIDISGLKTGVYLINMTVNGNSISKKLNIVE